MSAALIAIGVIAFLAIDAYVIYRVFGSRASADDYGSFMVPGEASVTLPAGGKLKISYQEEYTAPGGEGSIEFYVPKELQIQVTGPSGDQLDIKGPGFRGMGQSAPRRHGAGDGAGRPHGHGRPGRRGGRAEDPAREVGPGQPRSGRSG